MTRAKKTVAADPDAPPKKRGRPPKARPAAAPVVHGPLDLLEVSEPGELDALYADGRLNAHLSLRLDERHALVALGSRAALLDALRKAGHQPSRRDGA